MMLKSFPGITGILVLTAILLLLQTFLGRLALVLVRTSGDFWGSNWGAGFFTLIAFGLTLSLGLSFSKNRNPEKLTTLLAFQPARARFAFLFWGIVLAAFGGGFVLGEISDVVSHIWPISLSYQEVFKRLVPAQPQLGTVFLLGIVAPLTEETLFRGFFFHGTSRRYGPGPAVFLTSAVFALAHMNPWQASAAFLAGFYLSWLVQRSGSLFPSILAHGLYNLFPVLLAWSGQIIGGYNDLPGQTSNEPLPWMFLGLISLFFGLFLTSKSFHGVSDKST
ncbi:MAG: CPBP family intramembrane metalloprotease [Spirochaetales bacterium]|nr:CPBP family intramembrane metalloprotease [Spirochaetales bacterium]